MPRYIPGILVLLFLSPSAHAQDQPKIEIFGGFSYANINAGEHRVNTKGWHFMIAVNSRMSWLEFAADVSGHYGKLAGSSTATYIAMAGPRLTLRRGRMTGFVHSLYGVSFGHPSSIPLDEFDDRPQRLWFTFVPGGGGLDIELNRRVAVRLFQVDLIFPSRTPEYLQPLPQTGYASFQVRFSTGIVLRFGKV
ncbi:MAG TPA: hypothetical protein VLM38_05510 [Blastocatellia bacterium]|nr:hypothetical protein [Blastocatellia bacterium]